MSAAALLTETMAAEYDAGATLKALAAKYGMKVPTIHSRLVRAGVVMRPAHVSIEARARAVELRDRIVALYQDGMSIAEIRDRTGRSCSGVVRHLDRAGIVRARAAQIRLRAKARTDRVVALYRAGLKTEEIARRVGLPGQECVYRYLRRAGEPIQNRRRLATFGRKPRAVVAEAAE